MTMETNVLFLQVKTSDAPGLKPTTTRNNSSTRYVPGQFNCVNAKVASVAHTLENQFGIPVIDQTGLTRRYDIDLKWDYWNDPRHGHLRQALNEQLGLDVVYGTAPVEMLVVEKAN